MGSAAAFAPPFPNSRHARGNQPTNWTLSTEAGRGPRIVGNPQRPAEGTAGVASQEWEPMIVNAGKAG
jgi:hypothetical protein